VRYSEIRVKKLNKKDYSVEFINEFPNGRLDTMEPYGEPFVPEYVYNALRGQKKFDTLLGRQEDSEEFLCFLLDGLHEEMTAVIKEQHNKVEMNGNGGDWLEVGSKNKTSNLHSVSILWILYACIHGLLFRLDLMNHLFPKYLVVKRDLFCVVLEPKTLSIWNPFNHFHWIFNLKM
jgi:hypothetical protein